MISGFRTRTEQDDRQFLDLPREPKKATTNSAGCTTFKVVLRGAARISIRINCWCSNRIEHVFSGRSKARGAVGIVRTIGTVRAHARIGLQNLAYNIRRLVMLERLAAA